MEKTVWSHFSSAGLGELGVEDAGLSILESNELLQNRCSLYRENYPSVENICGDIWEKEREIIAAWKGRCHAPPFLVYATPPCQGMSSNGAGKLLNEVRKGNRKPDDPRNRLIIPTMHIIKELRPIWILLENVPTMNHTVISDENGTYVNIIEYIQREM